MSDRARKRGGRRARQESSRGEAPAITPYIKRKIPEYQILDEEGLALIENNADTILEEIGIDFRYEPALKLFREAGADIDGEAAAPLGLAANGTIAVHEGTGVGRLHREHDGFAAAGTFELHD